jgi:hypothetical protein
MLTSTVIMVMLKANCIIILLLARILLSSESEILKANCSIIYPLRYHYIVIRNKGMILFDNLIYVLHLHSIYVENIQELYKLNSKKCLMINLD